MAKKKVSEERAELETQFDKLISVYLWMSKQFITESKTLAAERGKDLTEYPFQDIVNAIHAELPEATEEEHWDSSDCWESSQC